jgi:peptidoglycan/LPS O-acetylase OafA/YrhL
MGEALIARGHVFLGRFISSATASGVEMFFILSGAVLLRSYARDGRSLSVGTYAIRRVQRIWPPYLVAWALSGAAILAATQWPTWWTQTADLPPFSVRNWLDQVAVFYAGNASFNFAWWSLSIELLFYAAVPLIVPAIGGAGATKLRLTLAVGISAAVAVAAHNSVFTPFPQMVQTGLTYLPCFAAGILLAKYDLDRRSARALLAAGAIYCAASSRFAWLNVHVGWMLVYLGVMGLALNKGTSLARQLSRWALVWLGERSYSLFLVHYAIFTMTCHGVSLFFHAKGVPYYVVTRLIELPAALLAAMALFYFVERRFARGLATGNSFWPVGSHEDDGPHV